MRLQPFNFSGRFSTEKRLTKRRGDDPKWTALASIVIILLIFSGGSRGLIAVSDMTSYPQVAQDQRSIYAGALWASANLYPGTSVISNAWQLQAYYTGSPPVIKSNISAFYAPIATDDDIISLANHGYHYFLLVNVTIPLDVMKSLNSSGYFQQIWTDGISRLYFFPLPVSSPCQQMRLNQYWHC